MDYYLYPHYWVNHLGFLLRKQLAQDFAKAGHNVTAEEWAVLLVLQVDDGLTSTELSNRTLRDKTTVTRMIDRMVEKGRVERVPDPDDRRVQRLHLSDQGYALFDKLAVLAGRMIARSVEGIDADDLDQTVRTLNRIADNMLCNSDREVESGL